MIKNYSTFKKLTLLIFLLFSLTAFSQTQIETFTTSGTFTVPCGVTSIIVEAWGGGGGGQGAKGDPSAGGGGSGGGYVKTTIVVTAGNNYNYSVGTGGAGSSGANGTESWFINNTTLKAIGGRGAGSAISAGNSWGLGATAPNTGNVGGTIQSTYGGSGGNAGNNFSGGGGSSGGSSASGNASGMTGGTAPTDGYAGVNGRNSNGDGANGEIGAGGAGGRTSWGWPPISFFWEKDGGDGGDGQIRITYISSFQTYCSPTFTSGVEPITNVTFAGINNTTPNTLSGSSLESFCDIGTVVQGSATNPISIKGNTDGNYVDYVRAYIDWNQDGDFFDVGESYNIGSISKSTGIDAITLIGNIAVPATATLGNTRMRIIKRWNADPTDPCQTGSGYGQAEDYTIKVIASRSITTGTISPTSYCAGATISIPYTKTGTFNNGNTFTAQLSNASGSFDTPVNIGTSTSTASPNIILGTIPVGTAAGLGYRIRVVSSNPIVTGNNNGSNLSISTQPTAPTTTGALMCIGSTATLSASGAVAGDRYKWYIAATGGTPLKTSTTNTDDTYVTGALTATTDYWVSILNSGGCESARTIVTATFPALSPDSQTTAGTDTWIGHVYDGTNAAILYNGNFTNYYGTFTEPETFDENFGGNTTCFAITSSLGGRSIYTETFAVRFRMNSTKKGLYLVDLGSDDGSRLTVDGALIYNNWALQGWTLRPRVLMSLTGNSSLLYDFYENGGGNRVNFNNLIPILSNTLSTNTSQNICPSKLGDAISGDTYGTLPTGISLSGTGYQWTYSTTLGGARTNISGATGATFTPNGSIAPFNSPGTYYVYRNAIVSSTNNIGASPYVATNESNVATIVINDSNTWNGSSDKNWNNAANWCSGVPSITNNLDVLIPSALSTPYSPTLSTGDFGYVENILFEDGSILTVEGNYLFVKKILTLNGKIDLNEESQLVQDNESTFDVASTGTIEIDQQGTSDNFKYNYWGSPVNKTGTTHTIANVLRDGTDTNASPLTLISFGAAYTFADGSVTSPIRLSTYWMYKYANLGNGYSGWTHVGKDGTLKAGEGFTMKGSNTNLPEQNYTFVGKPNNGDINLNIDSNNDYLIGNPYPSAIDAKQFIRDNIKKDVDGKTGNRVKNIIDGNLYFWDHFGGGTHLLKSYEGGYAIFNLSGSVLAVSNDILTKNTGATSTSEKVPQRFIPVAQGFFVTSLDGGEIQFKNSQRKFKKESTNVSQFMKSARTSSESEETDEDTFPRIHLNYSSPKGYQRQLLVAFIENTTDGVDIGYDAINNENFVEDISWKSNDNNLIIQAVSTLNDDRILPLEVKVATTGMIKISIDHTENVPEDTEIFIKDYTTGKSHNISKTPFEIELTTGKYTDRFALTFKTTKLVAEDVAAEVLVLSEAQPIGQGIQAFMNNTIGELQIKNNGDDEILSVALINSLGQTVRTWNSNLNLRIISLPVNKATGVYMVQIITKNGSVVQKVMVE